MKRSHNKIRLPYQDLNKCSTIKYEMVDGVETPVIRLQFAGSYPSKKQFEISASFFFSLFDMKNYKKALYIHELKGIEISTVECYNFKIVQAWTTNYINKYDVNTIKYDDRFDCKNVSNSSYDPGPKGDRLNSMNRTWYEND